MLKKLRPVLLVLASFGSSLCPAVLGAQTVEYYHLDAIGSVRAVTDQAGAVVERHDYLPFGDEAIPAPATQTRQFTGKEKDGETGLDYFGARYYRSRVGRFTTVDPLITFKENLVDPQRWNRYAYVRNNPLRYTDPDGRAIESGWDVFNVAMGVGSLVANVAAGNWGSAALDLGGTLIDLGATAIPGLPGGASSAIMATRSAVSKADKLLDAAKKLPDDALVVRGGRNTPDDLARGTGTHPSGVTGVSVESARDKTLSELSENIPHGQVGCCTVGQVRAAGGDVVPTSGRSPNHATMTGLDPAQGSRLLTPTVRNPAKQP